MADNFPLTPGSGRFAATDQVTYSGDAADVQLMRPVLVTGAEGARTVVDLPGDNTNGLDVDVTRVSGNVTVVQGTASNLNATVAQGTAANLNATVVQGTAANLNATVVGSGNFTVVQGTAANLNATVTGTVTANAGTGNFSVAQATASSLNAQVVGEVADDSPDSGNPVKMGAYAESSPAGSTLVADADRTNVHADIDGLLMTKPFTSFGDILVERVTNTDGASTALTVFGATASARNMITMIALYNSSTTNGFVDIRDGTAGTVLLTLPLPANGGSITNLTLPLRQTTANTALAFDVSAALTTVYLSFIGFKSKV